MQWSSSFWHQPVCLPLFPSLWMPANKAVCVSELSASLPTPPAQPQLHNHCLDSLITPPRFSPQGWIEGLWGEDDEGKGKPPSKKHKEAMCSCFPQGFSIPPPLTPGMQFLLPRPQPPPYASPCQAIEFRKIWDLKGKRARQGWRAHPWKSGIAICITVQSSLQRHSLAASMMCLGSRGKARTRELFLRLSEH